MKKTIKNLIMQLKSDDKGNLKGGFGQIKGGSDLTVPIANDICSNLNCTGGSNNICENRGACGPISNISCTNTGCE